MQMQSMTGVELNQQVGHRANLSLSKLRTNASKTPFSYAFKPQYGQSIDPRCVTNIKHVNIFLFLLWSDKNMSSI